MAPKYKASLQYASFQGESSPQTARADLAVSFTSRHGREGSLALTRHILPVCQSSEIGSCKLKNDSERKSSLAVTELAEIPQVLEVSEHNPTGLCSVTAVPRRKDQPALFEVHAGKDIQVLKGMLGMLT